MKYDELSIGERIAVTFLIVLAILFALALFGYLSGRWDDAQAQAQPLPPSKYDERIKELDKEGVENAYREQIEHLFSTWMKDSTQQPARAVAGARNARKAFIGAMNEIERERK